MSAIMTIRRWLETPRAFCVPDVLRSGPGSVRVSRPPATISVCRHRRPCADGPHHHVHPNEATTMCFGNQVQTEKKTTDTTLPGYLSDAAKQSVANAAAV